MRASLIAFSSCLLMAACGPSGGDAPPSPVPPADAPAGPDFTKDINAVGAEPFWALEIRGKDLKLSGPDRTDLTVGHGGAAVKGQSAIWEGEGLSGARLKITLMAEPCSDGMSDLTYPFKATVETAGEQLTGCAAPADAWPKQPETP